MSAGRFPQRIKRGSCAVTIYKTPSKGYDAFTVVHYNSEGKRCRHMFSEYAEARKVATATASELAGGKTDILVLTGNELLLYRRALKALQTTGVDLDEAVRAFVSRRESPLNRKTVSDVVEELITVKQGKGRSFLYLKDLRLRLDRVAKAFPCALADMTPQAIDKFLLGMDVAPRTRNNFRLVIGTLLKYGQARGYVAKDHPGIGAVEKSSDVVGEVAVFTPTEMQTLLTCAKHDLVPALALAAFAGIRPEEIKRLDWADINLAEGHIEIRAAKSKTKVRRLIPILPNLRSWLLRHARTSGPVLPYINLGNQFLKLARRAKVNWKRNALRHSFVSYRTAQVRDIASVSLESGNSPQIIARFYLKCVTAEAAEQWFNINPGCRLMVKEPAGAVRAAVGAV